MFATDLVTAAAGHDDQGRPLYRLTEPLVVEIVLNGGLFRVVVPVNFVTDFASVPRWLWWLFPPDGPWRRAAVVHDYLYSQLGVSRFFADAVFREAMTPDTGYWTQVAMFYAVRCFGRRARRGGPAKCCGVS